ncbi:type I addiction module toxin, SymE family [Serratia fonticola]|uniref:SymE family type I addiction module toxin n=1 Tax=Serratia fonticola TaxID=47917 RepID=UPI0015C62EFA|nr:SymE family type I addiction module toxin [Serratia fonticola]NXZ86496.1 type I addiction module toxin, SymE family [Serratia fonticola]
MNGTHILQATTGGFIPELIIDGKDITKAGFVAGDWLAECGLTGQLLAISVMPGKVVIQVQQNDILA